MLYVNVVGAGNGSLIRPNNSSSMYNWGFASATCMYTIMVEKRLDRGPRRGGGRFQERIIFPVTV